MTRWPRTDATEDALPPGTLVTLPESAEYGVEWLILGRGSGGQSLRVLAADTHPLLGSRDIAVPERSELAPLHIRCRVDFEVDRARLQSGERSGRLDETTLGQVTRHCERLERGLVEASAGRRANDDELEYRRWISDLRALQDVLAVPERSMVARIAESSENGESVDEGSVEGESLPERWPTRQHLAWAAMLLLATSLSLAGILLLERRGSAGAPDVNTPFAILVPDSIERGAEDVLTLAPDAERLVLIFGMGDVPSFEGYHLEMRSPDDALLWRGEDLSRTGVAELSVTLPIEMFPDQKVRFTVFGQPAEGDALPLASYSVRLTQKQSASGSIFP